MKTLNGIPASPGIGIGNVHRIDQYAAEIPVKQIEADKVAREIKRFERAVDRTKRSLLQIEKRINRELGPEQAKIFSAHIMILEDIALRQETIKVIRDKLLSAPAALKTVVDSAIKVFGNIKDKFLEERILDIQDVYQRLIANLLNIGDRDYSGFQRDENQAVVAHDLTPSDMAQMDNQSVVGCAVELGGRTSHVSLIAQSMEIPCVVGCEEIYNSVSEGDTVIIDGSRGLVICRPDAKTLAKYRTRQRGYQKRYDDLQDLADQPAVTKDGKIINLSANIELPFEVESLPEHGTRNVGLYRTEFLYMTRNRVPTEDEQFRAYRYIARRLSPNYAIIRTLDAGGDKLSSFIKSEEEKNPFLGYRSIRICLNEEKIFRNQIGAILRASAFGNIKIMFPMISNLDELKQVLKIFRSVRASLRSQNIKFDPEIKVGVMVEVPSAALMADELAGEVDFFSIGTNDLIQFMLAVDRSNKKIADMYDAFNPGVLRIINSIIRSGHKNNIHVGCCGEMASYLLAAPLLLGMGMDELSMSPLYILNMKKLIRQVSFKAMKSAAQHALTLDTSEKIKSFIKEEFREPLKAIETKWDPAYKVKVK
jgi:phosphotransferase system enzyme I (PtsI)